MPHQPGEIEKRIKKIKNLQIGYIIISNKTHYVYGIDGTKTIIVWSSRQKAEDYIIDNDLDPDEDEVQGYPMPSICAVVLDAGFNEIYFDFVDPDTSDEDIIAIKYDLQNCHYMKQLTDN